MAEVSRKLAFIAIDPSINGTGIAFLSYTGDFKTKHTFKLLSKYTLTLGRKKQVYLDKFLKKVDVLSLFKFAVEESETNFGSEYDFKWAVLENYSYASVAIWPTLERWQDCLNTSCIPTNLKRLIAMLLLLRLSRKS